MGKRGPLPEKRQHAGEPCVPKMPAELPVAAKSAWRRIVPKIEREILRAVDQTSLADMCICVARMEECERDITERGVLVPGDRGKVKNPSCQLSRQYRDAFQRWSQRFGLTPWDRDRIEMPAAPDPDDAFDAWIRGDDEEDDAETGG